MIEGLRQDSGAGNEKCDDGRFDEAIFFPIPLRSRARVTKNAKPRIAYKQARPTTHSENQKGQASKLEKGLSFLYLKIGWVDP